MATRNFISSPGHFDNFGGETLSRVFEGMIIGIVTGVLVGVVFGILSLNQTLVIPGLELLSPWSIFIFSIFLSALCLGSAGAVVGIGVPRFNTRPDQGPIKRWRSVVVKTGQHREVFFVADEKRPTTNSPVNWKKRNPVDQEKAYSHHMN